MDETDWAKEALAYLAEARAAVHDDFHLAMDLTRHPPPLRQSSWFRASKSIILALNSRSQDFVADTAIPGSLYVSPEAFTRELERYRAFVREMETELAQEQSAVEREFGEGGAPDVFTQAYIVVSKTAQSIDHVLTRRPRSVAIADSDLDVIIALARRFHESVLALKKHPHGGTTLAIKDEWDCQYLFRSILAGYVREVRIEEWNPSVAGSSGRCEFLLKRLRALIELKYAREPSDQKKIKKELAEDFVNYGANSEVDHLICLVYDPNHQLPDPVALADDLSKPTNGLNSVTVIVCPPRS